MTSWSDVLKWDPANLDSIKTDSETRKKDADEAVDNLFRIRNGIQSKGEAVSALQDFISKQAEKLEELASQLNQLATATGNAADGVTDVQQKVRDCQNFATSNQLIIAPDGSVSIQPAMLALCQADPYLYNYVLHQQRELSSSVNETLARARTVDESYISELSGITAFLSELDDATGFAYDQMQRWLSSPEAQEIIKSGQLNNETLNELLKLGIDGKQLLSTLQSDANNPEVKKEALRTLLSGIDLAVPFDRDRNNSFEEHKQEIGESKSTAESIYDNMKTGSEWDLKPDLAERYDAQLTDLNGGQPHEGYFYLSDDEGNTVRSDALGNINYGYMMASFQVEKDIALGAANAGGADVGIGKDPVDDAAVTLGYELHQKYPDGITRDQYIAEVEKSGLHGLG